ncbi:proteasome beta subunit [Nocardioides sp. J9]|nr:proteasome beta subunit [Nocardioides sp. J9]
MWVVTADGVQRLPDETLSTLADQMVDARMARPDGPVAPLPGSGEEPQA